MKKLVVVMVFLMSVGVLVAGGGEACKAKKSAVKNIELTGKLVCRDGGSGQDCARVFRVANAENTQYAVCDKSKADLNALSENGNATLRVSGKLVKCSEGEELMIEKASKI